MKHPTVGLTILTNKQPPEKPTDSEYIETVGTWHTIQGEGPFAGIPAIFVRMAGCSICCDLCDSDYTTNRQFYKVEEQAKLILDMANEHNCSLVVITGGEPFRQKALIGITNELFKTPLTIQIETNGGLFLPLDFRHLTVVYSPKTSIIHQDLIPEIKILKYVVEAGKVDKKDGLPTSVLGKKCRVARPPERMNREEIFIQPADEGDLEKNKRNTEEAVRVCLEHGYRLCLQVQKLVGLP